jgi:hypothetical protein
MALLQPLADPILAWLKGTTFAAAPAEIFMSLHSSEPPDAGNECTALMGGRIRLTGADFDNPAPSVGVVAREIKNTRALSFGTTTAAVTVKAFGLWSAATGGSMYMSGDVIPDVSLKLGDPSIFSVGDLVIRIG